jgi:ActR/RegA family two-component response regulator
MVEVVVGIKDRILTPGSSKFLIPFNGSSDPVTPAPLAGQSVLIVEDDYAMASELAADLEDAGLEPVGPFPTVDAASEATAWSRPDFAVLDINLRGQAVFSLAEELARREIRFVFYTAYEQHVLPEHLRNVPCIQKPAGAEAILEVLAVLPPIRTVQSTVARLLPDLRRLAMRLAGNLNDGDQLVEDALHKAITCPDQRRSDCTLGDWLTELVQKAAIDRGHRCRQ